MKNDYAIQEEYDPSVEKEQKGLLIINVREVVNCNINKATLHLVDRRKTYNRILVACSTYKNLGKFAESIRDSSMIIMYESNYKISIYRIEGGKFVCDRQQDLDFYYLLLDCMSDFQSFNDLITKTNYNRLLEMNISLKRHGDDKVGIFMGLKSLDKKTKRRLTCKFMSREEIKDILSKQISTTSIMIQDIIDLLKDIIFWDDEYLLAVQTMDNRIMAFDIKPDTYSKIRKQLYKEIAEGFSYEQ